MPSKNLKRIPGNSTTKLWFLSIGIDVNVISLPVSSQADEETLDTSSEIGDSEECNSTQKRKAGPLGGIEKKFHPDVQRVCPGPSQLMESVTRRSLLLAFLDCFSLYLMT